MERERVKHLQAKFQGNMQDFPEMSDRSGSQLAASPAKQETPASERDQSTKLTQTKRLGLKNVPLFQDDVPVLGPFFKNAAWAANSKDRNAMDSSLHPACLQTGIREAPCEQKGTRSKSNLPQRSQIQQTWPLIKHARNQGVIDALLVPAKRTDIPSLLDSSRSISEKWHRAPKKKPLPQAGVLGLKPLKPQRPPMVDLQRFCKAAASRTHASPVPEPLRGRQHGHLKPHHAVASPVQLSTRNALSPHVPSSAREVLRRDQEEIYDDVEAVGPIGKGKEILLTPASQLPASPPLRAGESADLTPDRFSLQPSEPRQSQMSELRGKRVKNLKQFKKEEQADQEFRKKFKFLGEIRALTRMMVDPNVTEKKGGGKNLPLKRGEILDVIQLTSPERILCRNKQWKYGYVPRAVLLQLDTDIYDDVAFCDEINSSSRVSK